MHTQLHLDLEMQYQILILTTYQSKIQNFCIPDLNRLSGFFSKMKSATYNADIWEYFLQYIHDCQFKIHMDNKHFQIFQTRQIITEY
jgi:hypothetical protein